MTLSKIEVEVEDEFEYDLVEEAGSGEQMESSSQNSEFKIPPNATMDQNQILLSDH
jgi:hypothetical protein